MDALGIDSAHVYGLSMGGMVGMWLGAIMAATSIGGGESVEVQLVPAWLQTAAMREAGSRASAG